ncbi:MAG: alpha/beta fold hydrolase [Thermonemataceae bacterium]
MILIIFSLAQLYGSENPLKAMHQPSNTALDTLLTPEINGIKQAVAIKTDDVNRPILLFLSGGPGSSMMNSATKFTDILQEKFTIVHWDQRETGKTLKLNPSPTPLSVVQMQQDTYEVVLFLTKTLKKEKVYLLGSSWGNVLGFHIVAKHPDLLHAYFAVNTIVNQLASEKELLKKLKSHFSENEVATEELASVNPPFQSEKDLFYLRKWLFYKDGEKYAITKRFEKGFMQWAKTWSSVFDEVLAIDLTQSLQKVDCPVYFFVGKNDIQTSTEITKAYYQALETEEKGIFLFEKSGHQIHQEEPEEFQRTIIEIVEK